jgi:hypothetical protein
MIVLDLLKVIKISFKKKKKKNKENNNNNNILLYIIYSIATPIINRTD